MTIKKTDHIHKYFKTQFDRSGTIIYRCGKPGCTHFVYEPLIVGRISTCWRCNEEYVITKKSIKVKKMHCDDCTDTRRGNRKKKKVKSSEVDQLLNEFGTLEGE